MSKGHLAAPTLKTLFVLWLCLFGFVFHSFVFNGIYFSEQRETLPLAESRGEPDFSDSHTHEHEDDMTLPDNIAPHVLVGSESRLLGAHLSTPSREPNPLFPPPKRQ
jgi:hypothetical protein